jgi:hypothetical protein
MPDVITEVVQPTVVPDPKPERTVTPVPPGKGHDALKDAISKLKGDVASGKVNLRELATDPERPTLQERARDDDGDAADTDGDTAKGTDDSDTGRGRDANDGTSRRDDGAQSATDQGQPEAAKEEAHGIEVTIPAADGHEEIVIEAPTQAIADRLKALQNDGMRKKEWLAQREKLEEREAELRVRTAMVESAPEAYVLQHVPKDKQIEMARALLAEHLNTSEIVADLNAYLNQQNGEYARRTALAEMQVKARDAQKQWEQRQFGERTAAQVIRTVRGMIPEGTNADREQRFLVTADAILTNAVRSGIAVSPQNVHSILEGVISDYGFNATVVSNGAANSRSQNGKQNGKSPRQSAADSADRNADGTFASRQVATASASPKTQRSETDRLTAIAKARAAGKRVTPPGAGGLPAQPPQMPKAKNGKNALKETFKFLRDNPGVFRTTEPG